jgi:hypothetical protein
MADYSFFDENYDSYLPGGGFEGFPSSFDIPSVDLGGFDWSNVDFGGDSYGGLGIDLSSLGDSFGFDLSDISPDMSLYGLDLGDLSGMLPDVESDPYAGLGYSAQDIKELQEGTYSGPEQSDEYVKQQLGEDLYKELYPYGTGGRGGDAEAQEGGFYGNTKNAIYDPKTNTTTIRNPDGSTRTIQGPPTPGGTNTITQKITDVINRLTTTGPNKQDALLAALLGGLMGLLGKGSAAKGPVGYKGEIPKFTAVRGKPGEGTKFIQAAGGGLMDLAQGGRAARYLRGGTDGMADKIKTDIDGKQPARLSHGEFVIPADVVSHLGNGNSDAGADVLYDMMDKVRKARTGTTKQGKQINPQKYTRV